MSDWATTTLGSFISLQRGHDLPARDRRPGPVPVVGSGGVVGWHDTSIVCGPGIAVGRAANLGAPTLVQADFWPLNTTLYVTDFHGNDVRFTYYLLKSIDLTSFNSGSVQPMLNRNYVRNFPLVVPEPPEQQRIAAVLQALDAKIAANERCATKSLELAAKLFEEAVASDTVRVSLGDIAEFHNKLRVPLSSRQREEFPGRYPYYGANGIIDFVGGYKFNGEYVLVGEDGTVVAEDTHPVVQYVRGRFWVSNHAHVLTGFGVTNEILALALNVADVRPYVTGAVQPKLSMGNLKRLPLSLPGPPTSNLSKKLRDLYAMAYEREAESGCLAKVRDTLLPGLMSGAIRVREAEAIVSDQT